MTVENNNYSLITASHETMARNLEEGGIGALGFGYNMFPLFVEESVPSAIEDIYTLKKRSFEKPLSITCGERDIDEKAPFLDHPAIDPWVTPHAKDVALEFFQLEPRDVSLGIMLWANPKIDDRESPVVGRRIRIGENLVPPTVSFMRTGRDPDYEGVLDLLGIPTILGTSNNESGDKRANKSGHTSFPGSLGDSPREVCHHVSKKPKKEGCSTSTALLAKDGSTAWIIRNGSTPEKEMTERLHRAGVERVLKLEGITTTIGSYNYTSRERLLYPLVHQLLRKRAEQGDFRASPILIDVLSRIAPKPRIIKETSVLTSVSTLTTRQSSPIIRLDEQAS